MVSTYTQSVLWSKWRHINQTYHISHFYLFDKLWACISCMYHFTDWIFAKCHCCCFLKKWEMTLDKDEFGAHSCTVTRPDGPSYIFFLQFKMKVAGARLTEVEAIVRNISFIYSDLWYKFHHWHLRYCNVRVHVAVL